MIPLGGRSHGGARPELGVRRIYELEWLCHSECMEVVYHESRSARFRLLAAAGCLTVLGVVLVVSPSQSSIPGYGWVLIAAGILALLAGVRRARPGGYAKLTETGIYARSWNAREGFVPWSDVQGIEVVFKGTGRRGYRYPRVVLTSGDAPMLMLLSALTPSPVVLQFLSKTPPYDPVFDEKITALRQCVADYRERSHAE